MMEDLAELARQSFLARYPTNGHVEVKENRRSKRTVNFCISCGIGFEKQPRVRLRVERQIHRRKWTQNGIDVFYLCSGCFQVVVGVISGGI